MQSNIKSYYIKHENKRFIQGDIFQKISVITINKNGDVEETTIPYSIIVTQDCDLEQCSNNPPQIMQNSKFEQINQYLPNILIIPAFQADIFRAGEHWKPINIIQEKINSDKFKLLKQNKIDRYHFLPNFESVFPELILDFKVYFTIPFKEISEKYVGNYLITINELYRESLSQRFCNYLSRIGLPEL
ncbi:MAG: hypothetical protein KA146_13270 [Leptospiraceae bacterium]|nr:hypothetical protein [Leptospiraceae bacterium]